MSSDSDSDYNVEEFLKPTKVTAPLRNDESGDILKNFDDERLKIKTLGSGSEDDEDEESNESDMEKEMIYDEIQINEENEQNDDDKLEKKFNSSLSDEQIQKLRTGFSKSNRFVLYVTNLTSETVKNDLMEFFSTHGKVKSIRIPKNRKSNFAFVEMIDSESFKNALKLHNTMLNGREVKIQVSEGGKKKSANKRNILKQKNRCLAEMRNESKYFLKSGKTFGHTTTGKKRMKARAKQKQ